MSRTYRKGEGDKENIQVRGVRRDPPDLRRLARALIELAQLQSEADAEKEHKRARRRDSKEGDPTSDSHGAGDS